MQDHDTDNEIQIKLWKIIFLHTADIDECQDGVHDCLPSVASCVNTLGSFNCSCNHGYIGDGKTRCKAPGKIGFKKFFSYVKSTYHLGSYINILYNSKSN